MLKINRKKASVDGNEVYTIWINETNRGEIKEEELKNFDLPKNEEFSVQIKSKQYQSEKKTFTLHTGEIIQLDCYPIVSLSFFSKIYHRIKGNGIMLEIKQDIYL